MSVSLSACMYEKLISWTSAFFSLYLFMDLSNRNSLDGLVYFFRFEKKIPTGLASTTSEVYFSMS